MNTMASSRAEQLLGGSGTFHFTIYRHQFQENLFSLHRFLGIVFYIHDFFQYIIQFIAIVLVQNMSMLSTCFNTISDQAFAGVLEYARTCYISHIFMLNDD
jgi:succinate dehydrogenase/fumarate reductase cytochrome b subunit